MQQIYRGIHPWRSANSIKLQNNFIYITLRHGCSPVNLLHIFRTAFLKNTSEGLLLLLCSGNTSKKQDCKIIVFLWSSSCWLLIWKSFLNLEHHKRGGAYNQTYYCFAIPVFWGSKEFLTNFFSKNQFLKFMYLFVVLARLSRIF